MGNRRLNSPRHGWFFRIHVIALSIALPAASTSSVIFWSSLGGLLSWSILAPPPRQQNFAASKQDRDKAKLTEIRLQQNASAQ